MSKLIPEKRVDRNGRLVTRHVRSSAASAPHAFPAPQSPPRKSGSKPTVKQTTKWEVTLTRSSFQPDKELHGHLKNKRLGFDLKVNDVEVYDLLSVLEPHNAVPLMDEGITTSRSALEYLKRHNLERLVVDRSAHAQDALQRRIPAKDYLRVCEKHVVRNIPLDRLLDSVEVAAMKIKSDDFYLDVMLGEARLDDIKTIGAATVNTAPAEIQQMLWDLKSGTARYEAHQVRELAEKANRERCVFYKAYELAHELGMEAALAVHSTAAACDLIYYVNRIVPSSGDDAKDTAYKIALLKHHDGMVKARDEFDEGPDSEHLPEISFKLSVEMHSAGIDPLDAWEGVKKGMTVQQILAVRDHGVQPSVSSGWL